MVTIENEVGRFEADTEAEALKLSRAAKRKRKAEEKKLEEYKEEARKRADGNGLSALLYLDDHDGEPALAWRVHRPSDKRFPRSKMEDSYQKFELQSHDHFGKLRVYKGLGMSDEVVAVLERGGCGIAVLWLKTSGEVQTFAVGCFEGVCVLNRMPTLDPDKLSGPKL